MTFYEFMNIYIYTCPLIQGRVFIYIKVEPKGDEKRSSWPQLEGSCFYPGITCSAGREQGRGGGGSNLYLSFSSQRHKSSSFMACVHSLRHGGLIAYEFSQEKPVFHTYRLVRVQSSFSSYACKDHLPPKAHLAAH